MRNQLYINSLYGYLLGVLDYQPNHNDAKGIVILFPGFSQGMCDLDYFTSKISNQLVNKGYICLMCDLYGHGDSYGDFENVNSRIILQNIDDIVSYVKKYYKNLPVFCIARGMISNIVSSRETLFDRVICINPLNYVFENYIDKPSDEKEHFTNVSCDEKDFEYLLKTMGAESSNILGQKIDTNRIIEMIRMFPNVVITDITIVVNTQSVKKCSLKEESETSFVRDYKWQQDLINEIVINIVEA